MYVVCECIHRHGLTCRSTVHGGNNVQPTVHRIELLLHVGKIRCNLEACGHFCACWLHWWPHPWWVVWWPRHHGGRIVGHVYTWWGYYYTHGWHASSPSVGECMACVADIMWCHGRECLAWGNATCCHVVGCHLEWHRSTLGGCLAMFGDPRPAFGAHWLVPTLPCVP